MRNFHLAIALVICLVLLPAASFAAKPSSTLTQPIPTVNIVNSSGQLVGTLTDATFTLLSFGVNQGQLVAVGSVTGTLTDIVNGTTTQITQAVTAPVAATGSCQILHLTIGPIDLNLLGLVVHTNQIVLDITAQSGPGNLLGNLLCGIANLLNGSSPLQSIANALNQLLKLL